MVRLDPSAPATPRLPGRRAAALTPVAASGALHVVVLVVVTLMIGSKVRFSDVSRADPIIQPQALHLVFLAPDGSQIGGGGGGGGNQQPGPIRRAQGIGDDAITLPVRRPTPVTAAPAPVEDAPRPPSIAIDAKPLASGVFEQIGLPAAGALQGTSTGPGSGGGVGTGRGTGIGSGVGPGLGRGSGGGTGGGVYHAGGAVSSPRLILEVRPKYTSAALRNRLQGTVELEAVVTADGCTSQIRVVRSLDRGGLDQEAVAAVAQWRFEPGRLAGAPVSVLVIVMIDFTIR